MNVDASQWYGANTLLAGTWSAGSNGTVAVYPGAGSSVSTIGTDATVIYQDGGTITIQGANLRTTLTTVKGKLLVNGTTAYSTTASGLSVTNGGVLGGSGSISGNVSVAANSSLDAGATVGGIGTLSITGAVTLASGAGVICDYDGTTGDTVVVTGTLTLPAAMTVTTAGSVKPTSPMTILSSTNLVAPGGVSGWTLAGSLSEEKLLIVGNTVVIAERLSGTVLSCQ
jgi:fibronectin-binding autotransporter adhesin